MSTSALEYRRRIRFISTTRGLLTANGQEVCFTFINRVELDVISYASE